MAVTPSWFRTAETALRHGGTEVVQAEILEQVARAHLADEH